MSESSVGPQDPFMELIEAAVALHELFTALRDAGFTEDQAIKFLACLQTGEEG